tara:strand:- start:66 stop:365 length:300 start_codon:yes stop_codon:yes gene_type:complete
MAIIKFNLVNSQVPSYITDGGYFYDARDDTYIGIGSGGGTELTKAELVTRMQTFSDLYPTTFTWDELDDGLMDTSTIRRVTEAEYETKVNEWCAERGIS